MTTWPTCKYRLTQKAYIARAPGLEPEIIDPNRETNPDDPFITYDGKPGPHMQATCAVGQAAIDAAGPQTLDPTNTLSLVMGDVGDGALRMKELMGEMFAIMAKQAAVVAGPPAVLPAPDAPFTPAPVKAPAPIFAVPPPPAYVVPPPPGQPRGRAAV